MKLVFLSIITVFGLLTSSFGQIKTSDKAVISTPGVGGDKCRETIEFYVGHTYGVTSVKVDIKKKTTTVTWLTDRTSLEVIKYTIANLGFDADEVEAEEFAYKRLPPECKRVPAAAKDSTKKGN